MQTVLIVIHFLVVIALVGVVLLQPSEGGGFGGGSSFMSTRGTKSALTRLTTILAICFFAISIGLVVVGNLSNSDSDILNRIPVSSGKNSTKESTSESKSEDQPSIIDQLGGVPASSQQKNDLVTPTSEDPLPPPMGDPISNSKPE